jgi:hypothetical protein
LGHIEKHKLNTISSVNGILLYTPVVAMVLIYL